MNEYRRRFLQGLGAGSITLLAGCSSGDDNDDTTTEDDPDETTTGGSTTTGGEFPEITPESVIHQTAAGADIWDDVDLGHFFYDEHSGDFDVTVKVHSIEEGDQYAKGGIMFRNSMSPGDVHVMTRRGPSGASNVQWRPEEGAAAGSLTSDIGEGKAQLDETFWAWHRLVREGDTVEFHVSDDGEEWQLMAELTGDDVNLADDGMLGLAATGHDQAEDRYFYYTGLEGVTPDTAEDLGGPLTKGSVEILDEMPDDIHVPERPEPTTTEPEPEAELVNHFTFDGDTVTDEVSGTTGSMGGGVQTGASGQVGSAFQFDGEDDYAMFPGTSLNSEQATITGWFNVSEHMDWSRVMQVGGGYDQSPGEGDTTGGWDFEFEGPTQTLTVTTYGPKERPTKMDIEYDTWYFSALVLDGQNVTWHLFDSNGKVNTVSNEQARTTLEEAPITFFAGDEKYTAGMIDDVRGFDGVLSEDRITSLYEESVGSSEPPAEPELVTHLTFDGATVTDEVSGTTGSMGGGVQTGASGQVGSAFQFDGEDDYATLPGTSLNAEQATVTGWFNVSEHMDWSRVMQVGGAYDQSPGEVDTPGGWDLEFEGPTQTLTVTTYGPKERPTKMDIEYDTWYFSAVVLDGQNVTWHLFDSNGKVNTVSNEQARTTLEEAPITFFAGDTHYTAGMIDDVRGFNGALSEDRITSLYEESV